MTTHEEPKRPAAVIRDAVDAAWGVTRDDAPAVTIASLASELYAQRERITRDNGSVCETLKSGAPDWMTDVMHAAHGDMLPDDWRYACAFAACSEIHDIGMDDADDSDDAGHEFADSYVDTYTGARLQWLASNLNRMGYCDEAVEDGLCDRFADIAERVGAGQYLEALEVFGAVASALAERVEELTEPCVCGGTGNHEGQSVASCDECDSEVIV